MDSIGIWNIRGLKHIEVKNFLTKYNLGLFGLLETRVKGCNFYKFFPRVSAGHSIVTNIQYHRGGRIWLIWLTSMFGINICESSTHFIHCEF